MKLILAISACFATSSASASDFVGEMEKTFKRFSLCEIYDSEQEAADDAFRAMFAVIKSHESSGTKSTIEVTEFSADSVSLVDKSTARECSILIDAYDARCYYASCR